MNYIFHYKEARKLFINWYYSKHSNQELADHYFLNSFSIDDMLLYDDELKFALESFEECEQIKILWHDEIGQHCLKIKWEHSPWWVNQLLHFYYCVMLPLDDKKLLEPARLIRECNNETKN